MSWNGAEMRKRRERMSICKDNRVEHICTGTVALKQQRKNPFDFLTLMQSDK